MEMEVDASEMVAELCRDFDRAYTEIVERNKGNYNNFFGLVRELNNNFFNTLQSMAASTYDRYAADTAEVDSFPEEVRMLLSDKDSLVNAVQASQDMHTNFIDALEDKLVSKEVRGANDLAAQNANWQAERNRERISEIIAYVQRNMVELDELEGEAEDNADN